MSQVQRLSEAERLATGLDCMEHEGCSKAAAELRRLQARVEELEKICKKALDEAVADEWDDWYFVMKSALKSTKEQP